MCSLESLWDFLVGSLIKVLFVCCLVWADGVGGVGSPRNVGLGSTEGLSGAEEGRRQRTDVEMRKVSNVRGKEFSC